MSKFEVHNLCYSYCQIFILDGWWTKHYFDETVCAVSDVATSVIEEGARCGISNERCRWLRCRRRPTPMTDRLDGDGDGFMSFMMWVSWFGSKRQKVVEDDHRRWTDRSMMTDKTDLCWRTDRGSWRRSNGPFARKHHRARTVGWWGAFSLFVHKIFWPKSKQKQVDDTTPTAI